jgi:hypothetical protein
MDAQLVLVLLLAVMQGSAEDAPSQLAVNATSQTQNDSWKYQCPPGVDASKYETCYYVHNFSQFGSWSDDPAFYPSVVVYSLAFFIGITGNLLVIFALLGDRKARNVTSSFLVSLAIADVVFLLPCVPYEVLMKMQNGWGLNLAFCRFFGVVQMLSVVASVLNLTAVTVERYCMFKKIRSAAR